MRLLLFLVLSFLAVTAHAQFSAGLVLGSPTGISGKYSLSSKNSITLGLSGNYINSDYLWHRTDDVMFENTSWYYGGGVVIKKSVGARATLGAQADVTKTWHAFTEGSVNFMTDSKKGLESYISVALGARFRF